MRQQPGPIESYCLIKNKFPSNLFFLFFIIFFIFYLPIKLPATHRVRERPRSWERKLRFPALAAVLAAWPLGADIKWKTKSQLGSWRARDRQAGVGAGYLGLLGDIIPQPLTQGVSVAALHCDIPSKCHHPNWGLNSLALGCWGGTATNMCQPAPAWVLRRYVWCPRDPGRGQ